MLTIVRAGLACPVGLRPLPALAAMRAGLTRYTVDERSGITVCRLSLLPEEAPRQERMAALLEHALVELLECPPGSLPSSIPLFLALPNGEDISGADLIITLKRVLSTIGVDVTVDEASIVRQGRSGVFTALERACAHLHRSDWLGLVVAVDSLVAPESIETLSQQGLLLGPRNLDGRIAGEAAAAFLVSSSTVLRRDETLAVVRAIQTTHDDAGFLRFHCGESKNQARGLTRVFRALGPAISGRADVVVDGQPSEGYWGRELSYAYLRNVALMPEPFRHLRAGDDIGDAGAAAGAVALHRALGELRPPARLGRLPATNVLVYAVSDNGHTGALAIGSPK